MKTIIVGGVAGGASAAARLRRLDENMEIIMFERGDYISFANCGLPYYIGGDIKEKSKLTVQTPQSFNTRFVVDVRIGQEVIAIDPGGHKVTVKRLATGEEYTESYDKLLLSPGAEPFVPPIPGSDGEKVFTLRSIPDAYRIKDYIEKTKPENAVIIGGGFIGLEMADNLHQAGMRVTVIEALPYIAGVLDEDMALDLTNNMRSAGIHVITNHSVADIGALNAGVVILAVGVRPESGLAKAAGLALNERGAIIVDSHMQTSAEDIYAVGDAIQIQNFVSGQPGYIPLAGPANKQGRIAADNICGLKSEYRGTQGSSILKVGDLTVAATGLNEMALKAGGFSYDKVYLWTSSNATYYPGAQNMSMKVLFDVNSGRILGAQIVGFKGVDKRIDVLATAIRAQMTAYDLGGLELAYAPPYSSAKDPVNMAGFVIENVLTGKVKQHHWHDLPDLIGRKDITLLDVRTNLEYMAGYLEGSVHIPLDELRANLDQLDPGKPIYVNCQSGLRSYIACHMLAHKGFDCSNLAGGYRLYAAVKKGQEFPTELTHPCGIKIL